MIKKYKCEECTFNTANWIALKAHITIKHMMAIDIERKLLEMA
jgi:hypothetical protein